MVVAPLPTSPISAYTSHDTDVHLESRCRRVDGYYDMSRQRTPREAPLPGADSRSPVSAYTSHETDIHLESRCRRTDGYYDMGRQRTPRNTDLGPQPAGSPRQYQIQYGAVLPKPGPFLVDMAHETPRSETLLRAPLTNLAYEPREEFLSQRRRSPSASLRHNMGTPTPFTRRGALDRPASGGASPKDEPLSPEALARLDRVLRPHVPQFDLARLSPRRPLHLGADLPPRPQSEAELERTRQQRAERQLAIPMDSPQQVRKRSPSPPFSRTPRRTTEVSQLTARCDYSPNYAAVRPKSPLGSVSFRGCPPGTSAAPAASTTPVDRLYIGNTVYTNNFSWRGPPQANFTQTTSRKAPSAPPARLIVMPLPLQARRELSEGVPEQPRSHMSKASCRGDAIFPAPHCSPDASYEPRWELLHCRSPRDRKPMPVEDFRRQQSSWRQVLVQRKAQSAKPRRAISPSWF
ncbi:hypothetical protein PAPYR_1909 [Paratrimastix pyriformis]|uniref:Uncharacterized protein n=1 Tax=Paratrimastix pyriformis TaxID=342808 RepID=A0ABQ8USG2_9EUKA|nr:hypothetical protein PAPYR_1909 [Paratrimastix pyriformis]